MYLHRIYNNLGKLANDATPNLGTKSAADMQPPNQIEYAGPAQNRTHIKEKLPREEEIITSVVVNKQVQIANQPPQSVESEGNGFIKKNTLFIMIKLTNL